MSRPSQKLPEKVYASVMTRIRNGDLRAGDRLIEAEIAEENGVSRTPVRAALQRLVLHGHAITADGGVVVAAPSEDEVFDAFVLRETLEGLASRLAAQRCTELNAARLAALHHRFTAASERGELQSAVQLTIEFHEYIWQISGSDILQRVMRDLINTYWARVTPTSLSLEGRIEECEREHSAILAAVTNGQADEAESLARAHIRNARNARIGVDAGAETAPV
jgi:DNA-binding GntR family transcriptional regulator